MTLEEIAEEIKLQNQIIKNSSDRLKVLFILREIEREKNNGQLNIDDILGEV